VRAALALKGIDYEYRSYHLRKNEQRGDEYLVINPQGLVPALEIDGVSLSQSLAILEYLDEQFPGLPLLPNDPKARARVRSLAMLIGCDIHPLNNLRVLGYLRSNFGADDEGIKEWFRHWVAEGFRAMEVRLSTEPETGQYCHGDDIGIADICLVAQVVNNKRFDVDLMPYPSIQRIFDECMQLSAFQQSMPMVQPDAE